MFYGIMWFDAHGSRPVPPPGRAGPGRGGGGPGRGLAAGGALTWARAGRGPGAGRQEALSPPGAPAPRGPRQRRRISEEAAAPAGSRGDGGAGWPGGGGPRGCQPARGRVLALGLRMAPRLYMATPFLALQNPGYPPAQRPLRG